MKFTNKYFLLISVLFLIIFNEFVLVYFDTTPPLSEISLKKIRFLNFVFVITAFFGKFIFTNIPKFILKFKKIFPIYILPSLLVVIILDLGLNFLGFGYPSHYIEEKILRYPTPIDSFSGKPNERDHNEFGFRGKFENKINYLSIAFFGGSTGYLGEPTIIENIKLNLQKKGVDSNVFNFSSISSNHTQHIHRLVKYHDIFNFDIVVFYGGWNETINYVNYDPRPGYPYNFFFRNDLNPIKQSILKYSSILGEFDLYTGIISGKAKLVLSTKTEDWEKKIINKYWRDLEVANNITIKLTKPNTCKNPLFISVTQPGIPRTSEEEKIWSLLKQSQNKNFNTWSHSDFTNENENVKFKDGIHLLQDSRNYIGKKISNIIFSEYQNYCN